MGIFYENKGKNNYVCGEKLQDAESIADFMTLRGKNCCVIKFRRIYINL